MVPRMQDPPAVPTIPTRALAGTPVTEIGLGCWQLGGDWGEVPEDRAIAILRSAYESGVRMLDTAEGYGGGRSESLIGKFLADLPAADRAFVATKIGRGNVKGPDGPAHIRQATEKSLDRLGLQTLGLTQLHCVPPEDMQRDEVWATLRGLRDDGLVQHIGASVETVDDARLCIERGAESLQIIFNILRQKPLVAGLLEDAAKAGVALIVRLPLASGLLAGKMTKQTTFAESDHRHYNRDGDAFNVGETLAGLGLDAGVDAAQQVLDVLNDHKAEGVTWPQLAIRWVLDHPQVTTVIPGASRPEQAADNAAAASLEPLPRDVHQRLTDLWKADIDPRIRGRR
jgi:aryl-alcohol dehydrogenase-like predicted oxidoreductase